MRSAAFAVLAVLLGLHVLTGPGVLGLPVAASGTLYIAGRMTGSLWAAGAIAMAAWQVRGPPTGARRIGSRVRAGALRPRALRLLIGGAP